MSQSLIPVERIESRILVIRGCKVMLDADLAEVFGVPTKRFNEQVKRNRARFPDDFVFQLTPDEKAEVVAICDHLHHLKYSHALPYVFTEHGALMAANVLSSERAIAASVWVVRAFVRLRETLATHKELARKFAELEQRVDTHDSGIAALMRKLHELMNPPEPPSKGLIGFHRNKPADGQGVSEPEPGKEPSLGRRGRRRPKRALAAAGYR